MDAKIVLYTDGACRGNERGAENIGAWAYYLAFVKNGVTVNEKKDSQPIRNTTNNRMEIRAVIEGLRAIKDKQSYPIEVYSDSTYVVYGIAKWCEKWVRDGWCKVKKQKKVLIKNADLWKELYVLKKECRMIMFIEVRGHSGNTHNEYVDSLCNYAMDNCKECECDTIDTVDVSADLQQSFENFEEEGEI